MRPAALNNPWARRSAAGCWACLQAPKNHRRAGRSRASTGQDQAKPKSTDSERVRLPTGELVALCATLDFVPQFGGPARHCWRQVSHLTIFRAVGPERSAWFRQRHRHVGSSRPKGPHEVDETGVALDDGSENVFARTNSVPTLRQPGGPPPDRQRGTINLGAVPPTRAGLALPQHLIDVDTRLLTQRPEQFVVLLGQRVAGQDVTELIVPAVRGHRAALET